MLVPSDVGAEPITGWNQTKVGLKFIPVITGKKGFHIVEIRLR